jgi:hypothetical protein
MLREARQLRNVSDRLDSLAEQHPLVSEGLLTHAGSVEQESAVSGGFTALIQSCKTILSSDL